MFLAFQKSDEPSQSLLMQIASDAARDQLQVCDAMKRIPEIHKSAIPDLVLKALVTCIATVRKSNRRCLCPKAVGSDYCAAHKSAIELSNRGKDADAVFLEPKADRVQRVNSEVSLQGPFVTIHHLLENIRDALRDTLPQQENFRKWRIKCIEDAFLCERNEPFPLGLIVRRFFPGHGKCGILLSTLQKTISI